MLTVLAAKRGLHATILISTEFPREKKLSAHGDHCGLGADLTEWDTPTGFSTPKPSHSSVTCSTERHRHNDAHRAS
jgi:hypothetical protein